jgi:hypothetical protein
MTFSAAFVEMMAMRTSSGASLLLQSQIRPDANSASTVEVRLVWSMQDDETPLHSTILYGLENTLQKLVECRADVNLTNTVSTYDRDT